MFPLSLAALNHAALSVGLCPFKRLSDPARSLENKKNS